MWEQDVFEKRHNRRRRIRANGEFFIDADLIRAHSVDLSTGGIRLRLKNPVQIIMRMKIGAYEMERVANLVWARKNELGDLEYGLEYLPDEDGTEEEVILNSHS